MAEMQQQSVEQMKQLSTQAAQANITQQQQALENQEFFVPLKNIGQVQKSALADATAMAKTKVRREHTCRCM